MFFAASSQARPSCYYYLFTISLPEAEVFNGLIAWLLDDADLWLRYKMPIRYVPRESSLSIYLSHLSTYIQLSLVLSDGLHTWLDLQLKRTGTRLY